MLFIRESNEIDRPIIFFDTIKMVNYPTIWKWFMVKLLPDIDMIQNISSIPSSWMFGQMNKEIRTLTYNSTFPIGVFLSSPRGQQMTITNPAYKRTPIHIPTALRALKCWIFVIFSCAMRPSFNFSPIRRSFAFGGLSPVMFRHTLMLFSTFGAQFLRLTVPTKITLTILTLKYYFHRYMIPYLDTICLWKMEVENALP